MMVTPRQGKSIIIPDPPRLLPGEHILGPVRSKSVANATWNLLFVQSNRANLI